MSVKIILVDDHNIMREGLRTLLEKQEDLQIVGQEFKGKALRMAHKTSTGTELAIFRA